ncbi:hypothetical protein DITRI_Ditri14bG0049100 [Diplodiscus trichospermus]
MQGWFELLDLSGSCVECDELETGGSSGVFNVSVADSHGVFGGSLAGPLIADGPGPVQLIVASFKQNIGREIRKKLASKASESAHILVDVPIRVAGMVDEDENFNPPPAPITVRAYPVKVDCLKSDDIMSETHNCNSTQSVGPNYNSQKADDHAKASNVLAENQEFNSICPRSVGPNNLKTLPVSQLTSDEMIIVDNIDKNVP